MKKGNTAVTGRSLRMLLLCVAALAAVSCLGIGLARYEKAKEQRLELVNAAAAPTVTLLRADGSFAPPQTWEADENGAYALRFLLSNAVADTVFAEKSQDVRLCVVSSAADRNDATRVRLTVGTQQYLGSAETIDETTVLGQRYGAGRVYRFFSETGEELAWTLLGGRVSSVEMTLTVTDGAPNTMFTLLTEPAGASE